MLKTITLNNDQQAMLDGKQGRAKQMGMRLVLDLAAAAGASQLVPIQSAHLSGVSPLTGGLGLRQFLTKLAGDPQAQVAVPTTLNSAGCDEALFQQMRITAPDFLEHNHEIVSLYTRMGVRPTQSCIPYEWEGVVKEGTAAWAESNAICFANSYCDLQTNRESGLSALAAALTGYAPYYGLLTEEARRPNLAVKVTAELIDPSDFSILGDWIGKQRKSHWKMPYGPIPAITGLSEEINHEQKKALSAAAANYGSPLLYLGNHPPTAFQDHLTFTKEDLQSRYDQLRPKNAVSLVTIGCPQASMGELRAAAEYLHGEKVTADPASPGAPPPLWIFTSAANKAIAEKTGIAKIIRDSGALLLENTCPEVVPYDQTWVKHILTNSMKAEHYITSGLNGIPTFVMNLSNCIALSTGKLENNGQEKADKTAAGKPGIGSEKKPVISRTDLKTHPFESHGQGLPSQNDFLIKGEALVSEAPITFLGFVNRETGVIEEKGHPLDGQSIAGKILIFPKGSGSSVAPYVVLELFYRGVAPMAIINTDIDQHSAPACSLEGIPYAYKFDDDVIANINSGDQIELRRSGDDAAVRVIERVTN